MTPADFLLLLLQTTGGPPEPIPFSVDLSAVIATIAAAISAVAAVFALWPSWRQRRSERLLAQRFGSEFYAPEVLARSTRYYVPPNCSSVDPTTEAEIRNLVVTEEKLFDVLDKFLSKDSSHRHLLLLADSGMGKSSALLNYYVRNQRLRLRQRKRLAIVPLGIPNADEHISRITDQESTVLLLDAFDEDTKAIENHRARLAELMDLCRYFIRVVITCRTQFFLRDEEIPRDTGILKITPRKAGEGGAYIFQKLYLAPLTDEQVDRFLKMRYPLPKLKRRRQAQRLVDAVPLLSVRPMLLAFIPDLLETGMAISYTYELYQALIESWVQRESFWVTPGTLAQFSERLAVDLYCKREIRGAERIPHEELDRLASTWGLQLKNWQLTGRSLLNRDAEGHYKFAHRSIMEYLVVRAFLNSSPEATKAPWTDQMVEFLQGMLRAGVVPPLLIELARARVSPALGKEPILRKEPLIVGYKWSKERPLWVAQTYVDTEIADVIRLVDPRFLQIEEAAEGIFVTALAISRTWCLGREMAPVVPLKEWRLPTAPEVALIGWMPAEVRRVVAGCPIMTCDREFENHITITIVGTGGYIYNTSEKASSDETANRVLVKRHNEP